SAVGWGGAAPCGSSRGGRSLRVPGDSGGDAPRQRDRRGPGQSARYAAHASGGLPPCAAPDGSRRHRCGERGDAHRGLSGEYRCRRATRGGGLSRPGRRQSGLHHAADVSLQRRSRHGRADCHSRWAERGQLAGHRQGRPARGRAHRPRGASVRPRLPGAPGPAGGAHLMGLVSLLAVLAGSLGAALAFRWARVPLWALTGGLVGAAAVNLGLGLEVEAPNLLVLGAKLLIGTAIGASLSPDVFRQFMRFFGPGVLAVTTVLAVGVLFGWGFAAWGLM